MPIWVEFLSLIVQFENALIGSSKIEVGEDLTSLREYGINK